MSSKDQTYKQKIRIVISAVLRICILVFICIFLFLLIADTSVNAFRWGTIQTGKINNKSFSQTSDNKGTRTTRTMLIHVGNSSTEISVTKAFYDKYYPSDKIPVAKYKGKYWVQENALTNFLGSFWVLLIVVVLFLALGYWKKITQKWLVLTEKETERLESRPLQASSKLSACLFWIGLLSFVSLISLIAGVFWARSLVGPNPMMRAFFYVKVGTLGFLCFCGLLVILIGIIAWVKQGKQWNYWDKKNVVLGSIFGLVAVFGLGNGIYIWHQARLASLRGSCANHRSFLYYELADNIPENKNFNLYKLPYDPKLPGYGVFAKYTNHGTPGPMTNCNQGAPNNWYGGWQALNLPQKKLRKLVKIWREEDKKFPDKKRTNDGVPYAWCGKPTGIPYRLSLHLFGNKDDDGKFYWHLMNGSVKKEDIDFLNHCLKKMGEKPVPIDIPDSVNWKKYIGKPVIRKAENAKTEQ